MSLSFLHQRSRARRLASAASVTALTVAVLAAPAGAAEDCDLEVSTGAEYLEALECANDAQSAVTITLQADVTIPGDVAPLYFGRQDLTLDGNGYTVTSESSGEPEASITGILLGVGSDDETIANNNVTITDITVEGFAPTIGVVVVASTGTLTISDSTFTDNVFSSSGGEGESNIATVVSIGSVVVENSIFSHNSNGIAGAVTVQNFADLEPAPAPPSAPGDASVTVSNSVFVGNTSADLGAAINSDVPLTVTESIFEGNSADDGGAIRSSNGLHVSTSTFADNNADLATIYNSGALTIDSSTFSGNVSGSDSTVYTEADSGSVLVQNSTFTNNTNRYGALAVSNEGELSTTVYHSTFADNEGDVAHLVIDDSEIAGSVSILGSVFTGSDDSASCVLDNLELESAYNFDADGSCTNDWSGEGDIGDGLDAQLGALANNGGPTSTLLPADGSPLIDAIPVQAGSPVAVDQRGVERPQGNGYDIGAVEVQATTDEDDQDGPDAGVVTFQVKTDGGTLYGTASAAIAVTDINWTSTANLTGAPANTALPYGAAGFTVEVPEPGDSVTITLTAPTPFTSAYKVSGSDWTRIDGATFSADGTTVTYTLTDGGELDEDGQANGLIVDPVALAVQATFTG